MNEAAVEVMRDCTHTESSEFGMAVSADFSDFALYRSSNFNLGLADCHTST